jgi:hypothetical protein
MIMKKSIPIVVLLLAGLSASAFQRNIEQMKAAAERASGGNQAKQYAELAKYLVDIADQQFTQGNVEQAHATMRDVANYAAKAHDASLQSHGKMKDTEIILRETQRRVEAVKRTLAVEDRPAMDMIEKKIEQLRQDLLDEMFAPKKKEKKS